MSTTAQLRSVKYPDTSEVTRFICASIFLGHDSAIRSRLRAYVADRYHAMAENHGLWVALVARVLDFYDQRKFRFQVWHGLLGLLCPMVLAVFFLAADPDAQPAIIALAAVAAVGFGIGSYRRYMQDHYRYPLEFFARNTFDREKAMQTFKNSSRKLEDRVTDREFGGNVTLFSGFEPFVGAGTPLGHWSLVIDTRRNKEGELPIKFSVEEIEDAIASSFYLLSFPDLEITERLYVHGTHAPFIDGLLHDRFARPHQTVNEATIALFRDSNSREARVYKSVAVFSWSDQVRVSYFYRITFAGPMLYIESHSRVLQPIWLGNRNVDDLVAPKFRKKFALFLGFTAFYPLVCLAESVLLWPRMRSALLEREREKEEKKRIEEQALYNYGAEGSFRESVASAIYDHFFEKSDRDMYIKALEKQLLDAVLDFLEAKNVDTSELREQRTQIINSGLIIHGGLQAGAVAVGADAQATSETKKPKIKKAAAGGKAA